MRFRIVIAVLVAVFTVWSIRSHIHELSEVFHTYSTFHGLISRHSTLLYRYPEEVPAPVAATGKTPKIFHQIALGNTTKLDKYSDAMGSCRSLHADWEHMLWTDDNATDFLQANYPYILPHYIGYRQNIQRANILRYALLHKYGGVYIDLDVSCRVALDSTPLMSLPFVSPGAYPAGVNNAFIAAHPEHPFLGELLDTVPDHDMYWGLPMRIPYVENMMSTGCMFFSNQWMQYVGKLISGRQVLGVYILADKDGDLDPHMLRGRVSTPIFVHGGASSWHGWDAAMILMIGQHYIIFTAIITVAFALVVVAPICLCLSSRKAYRHKRGGMLRYMTRTIWSADNEASMERKTDV